MSRENLLKEINFLANTRMRDDFVKDKLQDLYREVKRCICMVIPKDMYKENLAIALEIEKHTLGE